MTDTMRQKLAFGGLLFTGIVVTSFLTLPFFQPIKSFRGEFVSCQGDRLTYYAGRFVPGEFDYLESKPRQIEVDFNVCYALRDLKDGYTLNHEFKGGIEIK